MDGLKRPGDTNYRLSDAAVAVRQDRGGAALPRIVATGRGAVADQILALAFATGVKVREDADLVEILSVLDVDSEIPVEALAIVAEILSYVYRANGTAPDAGPPHSGPPDQDRRPAPAG